MWLSAKVLKGQGTYLQTFKAFVRAMIYLSIPFGLSFVVLQFDLPAAFIRKVFRLEMFVSLIYGFLVMLKDLSEFHKFNFIKCFFTLFLSAAVLFPLSLLAMYLSNGDFNSSFRNLFVLITPISLQFMVMLALILYFKPTRYLAQKSK